MSSTLRVLIVEDSEDDAALLIEELQRGGYVLNYERVDNGPKMIHALESHRWDLVISDYSLPSFSAFGALKVLNEKALDLPCIIMSGSVGEDKAVEILKAGANDFIIKGKAPRLLPAIARELREAQGRRDRRRAEIALQEAEVKFQSLCESAIDAIISTDQSGQILTWNEAAQAMFGFDKIEIIDKKIEQLIASKSLENFRRGLARTPLAGSNLTSAKAFGAIGLKKSGLEFPIELSIAGWQNGSEKFLAAIIRDISDREKLEAQLRQSQKLEAIGQLAGGIAHDFNNLLAVIIGRSQLMMNKVKVGDKLRTELDLIYKTGERAATLTRQLLAFSRQQVLEPKVLDLNAITSDMDMMLRRLIRENIALTTILTPGLSRIKADPGQIEQVILNLVVNARDAMPNGGKLTLETANVELGEEYCRMRSEVQPGNYVMLAVSDTGHGMDATVKARIFEPFYTTKPLGKGTGLGLSTVFGIVKQSGGHIEVYSEVGMGTAFKIYLPQTQERFSASQSGQIIAIPKGSEVILVVEDEDAVRDLLQDILEAVGYTVLLATNGNEAIEICKVRKDPIDLLVTDVIMPEMGGPELAQKVKSLKPDLKVLFASGYTDHAIVHNGVLESNVAFIQKPFTPMNLARKVREVLDRA